jgi:putative tryptophan/tyrosine transport system substrate-binding protein
VTSNCRGNGGFTVVRRGLWLLVVIILGCADLIGAQEQKKIGMTVSHIKDLVKLAANHRIPTIYTEMEWAEADGLMSHGPSFYNLERRAAIYVDKILRGAKPADLPVEQPTKFEFVINLKAAKQIGLTIPPNVLVRADRVIK